MIEYQEVGADCISAVSAIYESVGWTAYLTDNNALGRAFEHSLYVLGAYVDGVLVGFIRCVGDGEHVVYVQDLVVIPAFQRKGIGSALLRLVMRRFEAVRTLTLMTDAADEAANAFYRALGMRLCADSGIACYMR